MIRSQDRRAEGEHKKTHSPSRVVLRMSHSKRILVADDSETVTTLLSATLQSAGYEVTTADNGLEAYELGMNEAFDLVIIDQLMPGLLGLEVIAKWREQGIDVAVIVLSAVEDDRTLVESFEIGASDFVRKPFRLPELLARIKQRLHT